MIAITVRICRSYGSIDTLTAVKIAWSWEYINSGLNMTRYIYIFKSFSGLVEVDYCLKRLIFVSYRHVFKYEPLNHLGPLNHVIHPESLHN